MAQRCTVCAHASHEALNARLRELGPGSFEPLAREFGLTRFALMRHRDHHLSLASEDVVDLPPSTGEGVELADLDPEREVPTPAHSGRAGQRRAARVEVKQRFLEVYAQTGNVSQSAREAGVDRKTIYGWQEADEGFVLAMREAENQAIELLEAEARTRATSGSRLVREVWRNDRLIERIVEYRPSDTVLVKLLQALRPEKYGERLTVASTSIVKSVATEAWESI